MAITTSDYLNQLKTDKQDLVDNLAEQGIEGLTGDETFTELVPKVLDIKKGEDLSDYFNPTLEKGTGTSVTGIVKMVKKIPSTTIINTTNLSYGFANFQGEEIPLLDTSNVTIMANAFKSCSNITTIPLFNTSKVTDMGNMFNSCYSLASIPLLDTSSVTSMQNMFASCSNLQTIPLLNTSSITFNKGFSGMFNGVSNLTDDSLDNILQMCINATNYAGTKTLRNMSLNSTTYSESRIQNLPHYQDFINAGWTIGY